MDKIDKALEVRKIIFKNIVKHNVYGLTNLWQDYMIDELYNSFPETLHKNVDIEIAKLIVEGILESTNTAHYKVTPKGQDLIFLKDSYTVDRLKNKILLYIRDNEWHLNHKWGKISYLNYCEKHLIVYDRYIFINAINDLISSGIFIMDEDENLIITQDGERVIYKIV